MALNRHIAAVVALALGASHARAEGFRVQRVGAADESRFSGSLDEKKSQPVHLVNFALPNGSVLALTPAQSVQLDAEPLATWGSLERTQREALEGFVKKSLVPFLRLLRKPKGAVPYGSKMTTEARRFFSTQDAPAALGELAHASSNPEDNEAEIRGCVARLNTAFHPLGLHLTFGRFIEFDGGTVELLVYSVSERLLVQINDRTLPVYVLAPFDPVFRVPALGMMEPYPPRIFIFSDMIELQNRDINVFLNGEKDYPFEDPAVPVESIPLSVQTKINQIVRSALRAAAGADNRAVLRWLVKSVARHEGQHLYIDQAMKAAAESRKIEWDDFNRFHERQAYLFELETSDPQFTPFVLLASFAISAALSDKYSRVGCGAALRGLQKQFPGHTFWDGDFNRPITDGLIPLFNAPSADIRGAASRARREVEKFITSDQDR